MIALPGARRAGKGMMSVPRPDAIRISFVIDSLSRAGTESQLLALIRHLDRDRFEPSLVLLDGKDGHSQALEPPDCPVLRLGVTKLASRRAFSAARELKRFWSRRRPDVVQAYFLDSAYFSAPIARLSGARVVRVRNNLGYWLTRRHRVSERLVRPFVHATITNCEAGRQALIVSGQTPDRVVVLENGVECAPLRSRLFESDVGCVANLRAVKNMDGLLRSVALMKQPVRVAIAGDGPEREKLLALRDALKLRDSVAFLGSIADVPDFLQSVRVAVLPSHSEGMSNALLEAMAAGRAVVATDVGANAQVLAGTGVLVPPGDDAALAEAMRQLLNDPLRAESLGRAARERVERHYSRDAMRRRFEEFYTSLVGR